MTRKKTGLIVAAVLFAYGCSAVTAEERSPLFRRHSETESREVKNCHGGAGSLMFRELLSESDFKTTLKSFATGTLAPGSSTGEHYHRDSEEVYIVFNEPAEFTVNGHTSLLPAGTCVFSPMGSSNGLYNNSDETLEWLGIEVRRGKGEYKCIDYGDDLTHQKLESPPQFAWAQFDRSLLKLTGPGHQGKGKIFYRGIWEIDSHVSGWRRVSHVILPPDVSIGYHQHNLDEEIYYVIDGAGRMTVDDVTRDVTKGDAVLCSLGGSHGIYNNTDANLEILICRVTSDWNGVDTVEFGDDLSDR